MNKHPIALLRAAVETIFSNPLIFYPFTLIAFIQLLILELLYFSPQFPLSVFFAPIIKTLWGEAFLHYPFNFLLLPKLFQYAQNFVFIFISSFLIGMAVSIIATINMEKKAKAGVAFKQVFPAYVHIFLSSLIMFSIFYGFSFLYELLLLRAARIQSQQGVFYILKKLIIESAPYVNLLITVFVTTLFAFVIPIIIIERRKIFSALILNFRHLCKSFIFIFAVVLIPTLLYLPVLLLRSNFSLETGGNQEIGILLIVFSIVIMVIIDAVVYTAVTLHYLLKQENK